MGREILDEAYRHFELEGRKYEYGRDDITLKNNSPNRRSDPSRDERDLDGDGLYGVDCSSLVWRGLKNAGYDVGNEPFATSKLFTGSQVTNYAKQHFDVVPAEDARKTPGSLQPGDILMFNSSHGRHVGIFKGYDTQGNIEFYGSQVSTGPALTKAMAPTDTKLGYWNGGDFKIVGALRPKPEFQVHEPAHGHAKVDIPDAHNGPMVTRRDQAPHVAQPDNHDRENHLHKGSRGGDVASLQLDLAKLGYPSREAPLNADGHFGLRTDEALKAFQRDHGLKPDGTVGPETTKILRQQLELAQHAPTQGSTPLRLDSPAHPDYAMYKQALDAVHRLDTQHRREPNEQSDQLAGSLTVAARREGLLRVDHAVLSDDTVRTYAVQGDLNSPFKKLAEVPTAQAANTPLEKSSADWEQAAASQAQGQVGQAQQQQDPQQTSRQTNPTMSI
ncbi:XVIPCD domain-containing protein [Dyella koreensis]|uniref:Peptidoglycan-binding protein n=1 Tax=Dyella koreensis TaxID=311235 RepID=A0ABW8K1W4_9GAMM